MHTKLSTRLGIFTASLFAAVQLIHATVLIDFDQSGRPGSEVTEVGWNPWVVAAADSDMLTLDGINFKIAMAGSVGTNLVTNWYKAGIDAPNYARLVGDGVTVAGGDTGGTIQLTISGLSAGTHTLLSYHNAVNGYVWSPINIDVNGTRQISNLQPTNRAISTDSAAMSYLTFTATAGKSVTVLYSPVMSSGASYRNVILNAIALDVPNPLTQASTEIPDDRDWHVNADSGYTTLTWNAAKGITSHAVYFDTDSTTVANATTSSSCYKGKQAGTTFKVTGLSNLKTYWWRIDEINGSTTSKGSVWGFSPRHLAFPGAEGYGRYARGGRGGVVVHVTNLNDAGAGSLREAVENDIGPRTIVFDVSGMISLASRLTLASNNVTVAGQTAPGKGICIRYWPFGMSGVSDVIFRFMKVRLGYTGNTLDGTGFQGSDYSIMDHTSVSWTIDESFSSRSAKNITLQRTMIAEALNNANHTNSAGQVDGDHGYAGSISGAIGSFHHNLLAHNDGRNWSMAGGLDGNGYYAGELDIFNNVVYNWHDRATDGGAHEVNFVNNYYKPGATTIFKWALNNQWDGFPGTQQYYCHGNIVVGVYDDSTQSLNGCTSSTGTASVINPNPWVSAPFFPSYATIQTAYEAYKDVLSDVGMTEPVFDDHDHRIVKETYNGTYTYKGSITGFPGEPDRESDVGGWESYPSVTRASNFDSDGDGLPDWYENYLGTSPKSAKGDFSDANADAVGDGYTNLERYLDYMATPHAETTIDSAVTFNLADLFRGYQNTTPTYKAGTNSCLTASIKDSTLTVKPKSTCGITTLALTVTDKEKSTKTRNVALFVAGSVTTGLQGLAPERPSFAWNVTRDFIASRSNVQGTLSLVDMSGRTLRQISGSGELRIELAGMPTGMLFGRFEGQGLKEERIISRVH